MTFDTKKERPILFSGPMVKAILAGTKTQTRRVLSPRVAEAVRFYGCDAADDVVIGFSENGHAGPGWYAHCGEYPEEGSYFFRCPFGVPGDRLWVRETFKLDDSLAAQAKAEGKAGYATSVKYRADGLLADNWRPSIFMPRWASRITLEVTDVRVERLQEITEADACAEGLAAVNHEGFTGYHPPTQAYPFAFERDVLERSGCIEIRQSRHELLSARDCYRKLWDTLNAKRHYGWDANPFVWVVSFRRLP